MNTENTVKIINRCEIEITGVEDISSYDSEKIIFKLNDTEMILSGKNFNVKKLDTDNRIAFVSGYVSSISYSERSSKEAKNFLKALFK